MAHLLLYFLALFSLSTAANWAKLNEMPAEVLGWWRLALASFILGLFLFFYKKKNIFVVNKHSRWVLASGFFFFLHLWTYKYAAKHTLISNAMILFATNPIWSALGGSVFFKEKIGARTMVAFSLAFIGIFLLVKDQLQISPENNKGNLIALLSAFFYAGYMLSGKKARHHLENSIFSFQLYATCASCFLLCALTLDPSQLTAHYSCLSWLSVVGLVVLPTLMGHFIFTYLVRFMNLGVMTCGKLLEPILASVMAYFIFHEQLRSTTYISFLFTGLGILILFWPQLKKALFQETGLQSRR